MHMLQGREIKNIGVCAEGAARNLRSVPKEVAHCRESCRLKNKVTRESHLGERCSARSLMVAR